MVQDMAETTPTGDIQLDNMIARFDMSRATEQQILDMADLVRPHIEKVDIFSFWLDLLICSDADMKNEFNGDNPIDKRT
jgi:hypothetical protein